MTPTRLAILNVRGMGIFLFHTPVVIGLPECINVCVCVNVFMNNSLAVCGYLCLYVYISHERIVGLQTRNPSQLVQ